MIELAIDDICADCPSFEIEDVRTEAGDHIIMCAMRKLCYAKRKANGEDSECELAEYIKSKISE